MHDAVLRPGVRKCFPGTVVYLRSLQLMVEEGPGGCILHDGICDGKMFSRANFVHQEGRGDEMSWLRSPKGGERVCRCRERFKMEGEGRDVRALYAMHLCMGDVMRADPDAQIKVPERAR